MNSCIGHQNRLVNCDGEEESHLIIGFRAKTLVFRSANSAPASSTICQLSMGEIALRPALSLSDSAL